MARLLTLIAVWAAFATAARADLLLLRAGDAAGSDWIARIDTVTGATRPSIGHDNEGLFALCVDAKGDIFASADILGASLIYRFDRSGRLKEKFAEVNGTEFRALAVGADGSLYGLAFATDAAESATRRPNVVRFAPDAAPVVIVRDLEAPRALAFDPAGNLCVADGARGILRFDRQSGAPRGVVAAIDAAALAFAPDGQLYVVEAQSHAVLRLDVRTGATLATVVSGDAGAQALAFGPGGDLFAATRPGVLRYDGTTGTYRGTLGPPFHIAPRALAFVDAGY